VIIPTHMIIALRELGVTEYAGPADNPRIAEYLKVVRMPGEDEIPWCAAYTAWVLDKDGYVFPYKPNARSFLTFGMETEQPVFGDLVVLKRGTKSWQGHVGFYLDQSNTYIEMLSGNRLNRVAISPYKKSDLLGYRMVSAERKVIT
jgi:uncharacterized protein (TIGR02594 family)